MAASTDYSALLTSLMEKFKPGGEIEKTRFAEAELGGKRLGAKLKGSAIGRGMGNASLGIPTQVHEAVTAQKRGIAADTTSQYGSILQNLAGMAFQSEEAQKGRDFAASQNRVNRRQPGTDVWGEPMSGSIGARQKDASMWENIRLTEAARRNRVSGGKKGEAKTGMSAADLPALFAAAGLGGGDGGDGVGGAGGDTLFVDSDMDLFGQASAAPASAPAPAPVSTGGYGPMFQSQTALDVTKTRHSDQSLWR